MPMDGVMLGFVLSALIVLLTDTHLAEGFCVVYIILTFCGYMFLRPRITNASVRLPLGTTLVCILVGFFIGGLLGALLAVPVYVTLRTLFAEWQEFRRAKVRTRNGA